MSTNASSSCSSEIVRLQPSHCEQSVLRVLRLFNYSTTLEHGQMAHDISTTNGKPAIAYFGDTPWHGLGTRLEEPANAELAIQAAGLDYQVELQDMTTPRGSVVPGRKAVVRSDTHEVLGVATRHRRHVTAKRAVADDRPVNRLRLFEMF